MSRAAVRSAPGPDAAVYVISVAAELTGLHPQTLRTYERLGLITPGRTGGGGRRYSHRDIELLREIADLTVVRHRHRGRPPASSSSRTGSPPSPPATRSCVAELEATREALRQALAARRRRASRSTSCRCCASPRPASRSWSGAAAADAPRGLDRCVRSPGLRVAKRA